MTRRPKPTSYGNGEPWPEPCTHPTTTTVQHPASGDYIDGVSVVTPARVVQVCETCGEIVHERDEHTRCADHEGSWGGVDGPEFDPRSAVYICGGNLRPGPRSECAHALHDWPLPAGYIEADEVAQARLRRGWSNRLCPECDRYGWMPGRINPETDVRVGPASGGSDGSR